MQTTNNVKQFTVNSLEFAYFRRSLESQRSALRRGVDMHRLCVGCCLRNGKGAWRNNRIMNSRGRLLSTKEA